MKILLLISLLALTSCHQTAAPVPAKIINSSILNGTVVTEENTLAKSVVSIFAHTNNVWFNKCTASVLSEKLIITAAHCLKGKAPRDLMVNFSLKSLPYEKGASMDEFVITYNYEIRRVRSFRLHPKYNATENDIAVILLDEAIPKTAVPVKLLPEEYLNRAANKTIFNDEIFDVTLMGVGVIDDVNMTESKAMRVVNVPGVFYKNLLVTNQRNGKGACLGDSGGPAFIDIQGETYLVGVTHGPYGAAKDCHTEGAFTNPAFYVDFLQAAILDFQKLR